MTELDPEAQHVLSLVRAARTPSEGDKVRVERRLALALGVAAAATPALAAAEAVKGAGILKGAAGLVGLKWWLSGTAMLSAAVLGYATLSPAAPRAPVEPERARAHSRAPLRVAPESVSPAPMPAPAMVQAPVIEPVRSVKRSPRDPKQEVDLLHRAQAAWRTGDAQNALVLLRDHAARYPRSPLSVERDALSVLSLCALGQDEQARRIAHKLLSRAPKAPVRRAVEQSCALR